MEIKQEIAQVQKRPETFEDIRKDAEARFRELVEAWMQRRSTFQTTLGAMQAFNNVFDRLEAARKREIDEAEARGLEAGGLVEASRHKPAGNVAALREALKLCVEQTCNRCRDDAAMHGNHAPCLNGCETMNRAKVALAAPARNCDIAQDWLRDLYVKFKPPASVKREMPPEWVDAVMSFCRWLVATAQEGGAK